MRAAQLSHGPRRQLAIRSPLAKRFSRRCTPAAKPSESAVLHDARRADHSATSSVVRDGVLHAEAVSGALQKDIATLRNISDV